MQRRYRPIDTMPTSSNCDCSVSINSNIPIYIFQQATNSQESSTHITKQSLVMCMFSRGKKPFSRIENVSCKKETKYFVFWSYFAYK